MPSLSQTSHIKFTPSESEAMCPEITRFTWASLAAS